MRYILLFTVLILTAMSMPAKYTVHSVSGDVSLERGGKVQRLASGMEVGGVDKIVVGANSAVEILNSADSKVYRCEKSGSYTPTRIMMNASRSASSKVGAIAKTARFGNQDNRGGGTVYSEGCLVTRALESYDPEGATMQVDAMQLALSVVGKMSGSPSDSLPVPLRHGLTRTGKGLEFAIDNTFDYPIYVNVVKLGREPDGRRVMISELGQPVGCYILLPGQSLMRSHTLEMNPEDRHMLIMTRCYFDTGLRK